MLFILYEDIYLKNTKTYFMNKYNDIQDRKTPAEL